MALTKSTSGKLLIGFLLLRIGLVLILFPNPEAGIIVDSPSYLGLAQQIDQDGNLLEPEREDLVRPIGYPFLIFLFSGLASPNPIAVALMQLILSSMICVLLFLIGAGLGHPIAGLVSAWLYALSPHAALWSLTVMTEITFAFSLALALLLWVAAIQTGRWYWFLLCGGVLGAGALIRPIGLYLVILWVVITVVYSLRRADFRQALAWTGSLIIGFSLLVLPWMMRNYWVRDEFVFSTVTGKTLYGFNLGVVVAEAEGISREGGVLKVQESDDPLADTLAVLREYPLVFIREEANGIFRTAIGVESGVWARLFGYGRERQGGFGVLSLLRAGQIGEAFQRFGGLLSEPETSFHFGLSTYGMLHTIIVYVLLLLSIPWALKGGGQSAWVVLLCGITALYFIIVPGAAGQARFRVPVEPILISMAGFGWLYLCSFLKKSPTREAQLVDSNTSLINLDQG